MKITNTITLIVTLFCILTNSSNGQTFYKKNFKDAVEACKNENKKLVIIRYDKSAFTDSSGFNLEPNNLKLDSLLKINAIQDKISRDFVIFPVYESTSDSVKLLENFYLTFTPNILIFTPTLKYIGFKDLSSYSGFSITSLFPDILNLCLTECKPKINMIDELEKAYLANTITLKNLAELIKMEDSLGIRTKDLLNTYARKKGTLDSDLLKAINNASLKLSDPMTEYFLSYQDNELDIGLMKMSIIQVLVLQASIDGNKEDFEKVNLLKAKYDKSINEESSRMMEKINLPSLDTIREQNWMSAMDLSVKLEFYISIKDTTKIIEIGKEVATLVTSDYTKKRTSYIQKAINPYGSNKQVLSNTKTHKEFGNSYDTFFSIALNNIAWNYYLFSKKPADLKKALNWIKFALSIKKTPESLDTFAHLLFSLGKSNDAILVQKNALKMAINNKKDSNSIERYRFELRKFQNYHH